MRARVYHRVGASTRRLAGLTRQHYLYATVSSSCVVSRRRVRYVRRDTYFPAQLFSGACGIRRRFPICCVPSTQASRAEAENTLSTTITDDALSFSRTPRHFAVRHGGGESLIAELTQSSETDPTVALYYQSNQLESTLAKRNIRSVTLTTASLGDGTTHSEMPDAQQVPRGVFAFAPDSPRNARHHSRTQLPRKFPE